MKPRKRRMRQHARQQRTFRANDLRIEAIIEKTKQELDNYHSASKAHAEQKHKEQLAFLAEEQKKNEKRTKIEAAKKKVDQYKEMSYTELRKAAKDLEISIYRRKKDDILNEILMKVGQESNDPEETHKPLRTQNVV